MQKLTRAAGAIILTTALLIAVAGCGDDGGGGGGEGAELYNVNCATCHGGSGDGGLGPSLHGVADRLSLDEHIKTVTEGRGGRMPSFEGDLTAAEIEAVVNYERSEFE